MRATRAPWWMYIIVASFLGYFALEMFTFVWNPAPVGFDFDYSADGSMIAREIYPQAAAAHAGLRAGDRILAANGIPIRKRNWYMAGANFEPERPIPIDIEREGKRIELTVTLRRDSLRGAARRGHFALLSGNRLATHADGFLGAAARYYQNPGLRVPRSHVVVPDCMCRKADPREAATVRKHMNMRAGHRIAQLGKNC